MKFTEIKKVYIQGISTNDYWDQFYQEPKQSKKIWK